MLLWAGVLLIVIGVACLPLDRWAAHLIYDHESAAFERFLQRTTHFAKAAHWLIAAIAAYAIAQVILTFSGRRPEYGILPPRLTSRGPARQAALMLLWAGVLLIVIGVACLPLDRWAAHLIYDHESAAFERFLQRTTHFAKAAHWLIAAIAAYAIAQVILTFKGESADARLASDCSLAFIVCLAVGSIILHGMKLVIGRRRPRDDMEMGLYGFVWFKFKLDYNSFPSGHALTIMSVAVILTCVWPHLAILWFVLALWLGLTRALLTAHFLSDVFVGAGIGLLASRETLLYLFPHLPPPWF